MYYGFVLAFLAALLPFAALPLAYPQPAPAYAAALMRGKQ